MPGKKGNEVAQRMRTLPQFARTPIVLMTAYSLSESERKAMMTGDGVDHILNKPLPDFEQLRTILHDLVTRKQSDALNRHRPLLTSKNSAASFTGSTGWGRHPSASSANSIKVSAAAAIPSP